MKHGNDTGHLTPYHAKHHEVNTWLQICMPVYDNFLPHSNPTSQQDFHVLAWMPMRPAV
jgi:hypothetical protein